MTLYNVSSTHHTGDVTTSPTVGKPAQPQQRHSSSTFIAHLLVQEYPPKVQPRSSSARDNALFGHLDRVDAEAGCILIALANHDKRKDMNDLIPYSIRVIDYNQIATTAESTTETGDSNNGSSSNCSTSDSPSPQTDNEEPTATKASTPIKDESDNNGTMSITNLIGSMASSTNDPTLPQQQQPSTATAPIAAINNAHDPMSQKPSSWWKQKPKTDPILLLAAAAKAIDQDEQLSERANQKRKYSDDDSSLDSPAGGPSIRPRHSVEDYQTTSSTVVDQRQSEKSKFSYQYLSMKQNPKIKRNAMHAYITYMIYTDLASSDKIYQHDGKGISATAPPLQPPPAPPVPTASYAPPPPPSPHPTTSNHRLTSSSSSSSSSAAATATATGASSSLQSSSSSSSSAYDHHYSQHIHSKLHSYTSRINIPASGTTGTNPSTSEAHTATAPSTFTNAWSPYGLPTPATSIPSTSSSSSSSPPAPPLLHSGPSSIMARPLTAFLRDNMYS